MVDRNAPTLPPGAFDRLYPTSDRAIRAKLDSLPSDSPDREKTSIEVAREILSRRLAEDRSADRRAEARRGDRERALEEHYRERGY